MVVVLSSFNRNVLKQERRSVTRGGAERAVGWDWLVGQVIWVIRARARCCIGNRLGGGLLINMLICYKSVFSILIWIRDFIYRVHLSLTDL